MTNEEIKNRLSSVCSALNNLKIDKGIENASNLAGSYAILTEIIEEMTNEESGE